MNKLCLVFTGMTIIGSGVGCIHGAYTGYTSTKNKDITTNNINTITGCAIGACCGAVIGLTFPISINVLIARRMENIPLNGITTKK